MKLFVQNTLTVFVLIPLLEISMMDGKSKSLKKNSEFHKTRFSCEIWARYNSDGY